MADAKPQLDPALVEKAAHAVYVRDHEEACDLYGRLNIGPMHPFDSLSETRKRQFREYTKAALLSLGITAAALNALARGEATVVPKRITREICDARQDVHGFSPLDEEAWVRVQHIGERQSEWAAMLAASPYRSDT